MANHQKPNYYYRCCGSFLAHHGLLRYRHRRRINTENKANCRRFGLGGKIECRTGNFWCESLQHCVHSCCTVFLHFCWGDVLCRFVFQIFNTYLITTRSVQKQQKISDYTLQILLNVHKCVPTYITAFLISCLFAKPANTQYTPTDSTVLCTHTHSTVGCNIQISPHIFDPARLLSTRLIYSLNTSK